MPESRAVKKKQLLNCLRRHDCTFKRQGKRRDLWRKRGSTTRIAVPRNVLIDSRVAIVVLKQAGLSEKEIEEFLRDVDLV